MKLINFFLVLTVFISLASCIKRIPKKDGLNAKMIESLDEPRVIRDTIIKEIAVRHEAEPIGDIMQPQQIDQPKNPARQTTHTSSNTKSIERGDNIDRGNSGFFDQYQSNYQGDPNSNLKPTTRIVDDGADEIQRKKEAIEKSLDQIDQMNKQQKQEYERLERERQAINEKAIQKAKEEQKSQQKQPKGKTLNTDLLLNP